jgi:hypothetical protein
MYMCMTSKSGKLWFKLYSSTYGLISEPVWAGFCEHQLTQQELHNKKLVPSAYQKV